MVRRLLLFGLLATVPGQALAAGLLVIANMSVETGGSLSLRQIEAIYLLRVTTWPDGSQIVPVNREVESEIRDHFTDAVLKQDNASLAAYWNAMHFQGKLPPLVQESEAAMLAFVQNVPGAVGYVSASAETRGVRILARVP